MGSVRQVSTWVAGVAIIGMVTAACSSSPSNTSANPTTGSAGLGTQIVQPNNSGTPQRGGTLTLLGTGDADFIDPNISYYAIGYLDLRMWSRQLYNYPATQGLTTTVVPDLATAMPTITDGGLKYAVTIRSGAMWDTNPPRQVTAADVVRGVERSCNPTQPWGGQPDFADILAGYKAFCNAFSKVPATSATSQAAFINTHADMLTGVTVDPSNPLTVDFTLLKPATYFSDILTLPPFAPAPVEYLQYLPASNQLAQHTISDGPYRIQTYQPAVKIIYVRNPAWKASTDPIRKAYVDQIDVSETGNQTAIQQEISTNSPQADMEWDAFVPPSDVPNLVSTHDPRLNLQTEYASNPYIIFNTASPNNGGALSNAAVRQAISYAINRSYLIQDADGPDVSPPLTHILPPGLDGASPNFDDYPYDLAKAKQMLAADGHPHLTLKFLYRPASALSSKMFQTIQANLAQAGITVTGVTATNSDFYTQYLEVPSVARRGVWDLSLAGWSPDWYGDAAKSFFEPLFDGRVLPPTSSDFGLFNDPTLNSIIDQALAATSTSAAATLWHQADVETMKQAPVYPITDPNLPLFHGSQVHNVIYVPAIEEADPTNVWLSS